MQNESEKYENSYLAKGLFRDELLFASYHMEQIARVQLFNMLSWKIGIDYGYGFSIGKHSKFINKYLSESEWALLMKTYRMDSLENCWAALEAAQTLFRQSSHYVAEKFDYAYLDYDVQITKYIDRHKNRLG